MKKTNIIIQVSLILLICVLIVLTIALANKFDSDSEKEFTSNSESETGLKHNIEDPISFCLDSDGDFVIGSKNSIDTISQAGVLKNSIKTEQPVTALFASDEGLYAAVGATIYFLDSTNEMNVFTDLGSSSIIKSIRKYGDTVYISDAGNKLLYTYSTQGKLIRIYSFEAPPALQIVSPWFDFVVMKDASFWITNPGNHQIDLYSKDGNFLKSIPESEDPKMFEGCCNPLLLEQVADNRLAAWTKGVKQVKIIDFKYGVIQMFTVEKYFSAILDVKDMTYRDETIYLLDSQKIYTLKVDE